MKEHDQVSAWRERLKLTKHELAELTGYSYEAVCLFERGISSAKSWSDRKYRIEQAPVDKKVWRRWKLACSAVERQLKSGREFAW